MASSANQKYNRPQRLRLALTVLSVVLVDQLSKALAVHALTSGHSRSLAASLAEYFSLVSHGGPSEIIARFGPLTGKTVSLLGTLLQFQLTLNTGASWNLGAGNSFQLSFLSFGFAGLVLWLWHRYLRTGPRAALVLGLLIGGALSNGLDRFRLREVVDFFVLRLPGTPATQTSLPIFNVADICVAVGVGIAVGYALWFAEAASRRIQKLEQSKPLLVTEAASSSRFKAGLALDEDELADLRYLDTTMLPRDRPLTPREVMLRQVQASRLVAERVRAEASRGELQALVDDTFATPSSRQLRRQLWEWYEHGGRSS